MAEATAMDGGRRSAVVLLVDDDPDMREGLVRLLGWHGYECVTAPNGREALAVVQSRRPDVVVTDLRMPGLDGLALIRRVRAVAPGLPILLATAYATDATVREALSAGAASVLFKPFKPAQLLAAVRGALPPGNGRGRAG